MIIKVAFGPPFYFKITFFYLTPLFRQFNYIIIFYLQQLQALKTDWIILAGFLRKIPQELISHYPNKIINLHPSLLPSFGGKGMYGDFVHQAVLASGIDRSGITIHYVNEEFDKGEIIAQFSCEVDPSDTVSMLSAKIHLLEQQYFPQIIEETISE